MIHLCFLAAGNSARFGSNKLLTLWRGQPLWQYGYTVLETVGKETGAALHAVSRYGEILDAVGEAGVFCPESREGLSFSVKAACTACGEVTGRDKLLFLAADQPLIRPETLLRLLSLPLADRKDSPLPLAALPFDGEKTGNPVVFSGLLIDELQKLTGDSGGKSVLRTRRERIVTVSCAPEELFDVDRADDFERLEHTESGYGQRD